MAVAAVALAKGDVPPSRRNQKGRFPVAPLVELVERSEPLPAQPPRSAGGADPRYVGELQPQPGAVPRCRAFSVSRQAAMT